MLDVVIRGGRVVDGTNAPARPADVGILGDRIVAIGTVEADAARTIDATGQVVAPGFIDVHTHYDAQVFWDGALTPSPLHGVTSAIGGNCGFSIAPLTGDPADAQYLMRMLSRVEGMPLESLEKGVPWNWRSTGEYFESVDGLLGINAGFMVGHSAVRRVVMGPAAVERESTPEELDAMRDVVRASMEAGAIGFSTSWSRAHNDLDGHMVPSRYAAREELIELARVAGEYEGTSLEINPKSGSLEPWTLELMSEMSAAARRPINWNLLVVSAHNVEETQQQLEAGDYAARHGARIIALTVPTGGGGLRLSLRSGVMFDSMPAWDEVMLLPLDQKIAAFRDADVRRRLFEASQRPDNPNPYLAKWARLTVLDAYSPENEQYVGRTIGEIADAEGREPWDVVCAIALADDLNTGFVLYGRPDTKEDWQARADVWRDRRALVGGSDAGAHLDMMSTAGYTTRMLSAARECDLMGIEEAVHLITQVPAELYGLRERGVLREGWKSDVVVFDPETVGTLPVEMRYDLPGDAGRLVAGATGVAHVLVNGEPIVSDGVLTDARSGAVLRSQLDSTTPSLV